MRMLMYLLTRVLLFLAFLWAVRLVWRLLTGGTRPTREVRSKKPVQIAGELKKDPICGTYVSEAISLKTRYGKEELHFCSRKCQEEFLRSHNAVAD